MSNCPCAMKIMANNLLDTGYNYFNVSSFSEGFNKLEMLNPERSRVFRFGGRFLIEEGVNDTFWINGFPMTVIAGNYESIHAFLVAANETLYGFAEIGYDYTNRKFLIHKHPLQASITVNRSNNTNAIWETIGLMIGANYTITGTAPLDCEIPRIHWPSEEIQIDLGYLADVGFLGMIGDISKELKIPQGADIRIKGNTIPDFSDPIINLKCEWTKTGVFAFIKNDEYPDNIPLRYFEITITHPDGPFMPEIGYLYLGDAMRFIDRNISTGVDINIIDNSEILTSDGGQEFYNEKTPYRLFKGLQIGLANPVNMDLLRRLYMRKQKTRPFFVALDPEKKISANIDDMTMFCRFNSDVSFQHRHYKFFDLLFEFKEVL